MNSRWLGRVVIAASAAGVLAIAGATSAQAHDTPTPPYDAVLQNSHHNKLATDFTDGCKDVDDAGIDHAQNEDVWVFNTPSDEFDPAIGVKAQFRRLDNTVVTELIPGSSFDNGFGNSPSHTHLAWIVLPAGWTLVDAEGKTKGDQTRFVVTHTCPGTATTRPPTPGDSQSSGGGGGGGGGSLPVTGVAVGTMAVLGVGLLAAGVALLMVRRRRDVSDLIDG